MLNYLVLFCSLVILTACGGGYSGDRTLVTGTCKSCKPYFVRGSWHYPQNYYEYNEVGLASWYGPGFHGKPKPYGEIFDQNAMTAAHKTLPLPTIVRVTNLENGKSIKVLVDDRGPFVYDGRIIDLSVAAAKALGSYSKGIAKVRVQSLVSESKALADYLAKYGKNGRDRQGRTWLQVYHEEIDGRSGHEVIDTETTLDIKPSISNNIMPAPEPIEAGKKPFKSLDEFIKKVDTPVQKPVKAAQPVLPPSVIKAKAVVAVPSQSYVEVGGHFVQKANAEKLLKQAQAIANGQVTQTQHTSGQKFFVVRLGPFKDGRAAQDILSRLKSIGLTETKIINK